MQCANQVFQVLLIPMHATLLSKNGPVWLQRKKQHGIDQATMEKNELLTVQAGRVSPELAKKLLRRSQENGT